MAILNKRLLVGLSACLIGSFTMPVNHALAGNKEDSVKAAFVFNFIKFTTWPKSGKTINVCAIGGGGLSKALKKTLSGKKVKARRVKVTTPSSASKGCQVAVFTASAKPDIAKVKSSPVLTVADIKGFTNKGGLVEFAKGRNKVRFIVNNKQARKVKLKFGSNMLSSAKSVK